MDDLWGVGKTELLDKRFRQTLYRLRKIFQVSDNNSGNHIVLREDHNDHYHLSANPDVFCDIHKFIDWYNEGKEAELQNGSLQKISRYEMSVDLYKGDFLNDLDEIWSQQLRNRLRSLYLEMIDGLCRFYFVKKDGRMVEHYARNCLEILPHDEMGIFWLVKGFLKQRRHATAKKECTEWQKLIQSEMEIEPDISFEEIKNASAFNDLWK